MAMTILCHSGINLSRDSEIRRETILDCPRRATIANFYAYGPLSDFCTFWCDACAERTKRDTASRGTMYDFYLCLFRPDECSPLEERALVSLLQELSLWR